jgi:hypothetical protein
MNHVEFQSCRVLSNNEVSEDQWSAIQHAYKSIEELALRDWSPDKSDESSSLVPRFNQVGSATCTLFEGDAFMTLLDAITTLHTRPRVESSIRDSIVSGHGRCLETNNRTITVPVTPIVLRDLPYNLGVTPLILVNSFEALVVALRARYGPRDSSNGFRDDALKCWPALERVQRAGTVGWMAVSRPEVGDLYAAEGEMLKIEAWRRDLTPSFRGFIDALARDYSRYVDVPTPLFVVPIDAAGVTRPEQRDELFKLLPLLRHPRVLYLINSD